MPRPRLSEAEREARRRERSRRSFSDAAYEHYNPALEGYGSVDEWLRTVEASMAGKGSFRPVAGANAFVDPDLSLLGLTEFPDHFDGLKKAFRKAALRAHPDQGGSNEAFRDVKTAFERLSVRY